MKKPRLTERDRLEIEMGLKAGKTPYAIARALGRPTKTIVREIRNRRKASEKGAFGRVTNRCAHRMDCQARKLCAHCLYDGSRRCCFCRLCNSVCKQFVEQPCEKLRRSPWVCNGCKDEPRCVLRKQYYQHDAAQKNYRDVLVQTRTGANYSEEEIAAFDKTLHGLLLQGQSVHAAMSNNPDLFPMCEKTVYRYIAGGLLTSKNYHLPEKMKLKPRKRKSVEHKVDAKCRIGRTYADYQRFCAEHPGTPVVEMDTVEGVKGGKVLLTLHFMPQDFMLAFLLESKCAAAVSAVFAQIRRRLREAYAERAEEMFMRLFPVILTDNGTEFSDPTKIEEDEQGRTQTSLFYCDACQSWQKAHVERNHELLRKVLPKGTHYLEPTSFDGLTQEQVALMLSHVNGYVRRSIGNKTPWQLFAESFGQECAKLFGVVEIAPNDVCLKPSLLGIEVRVKKLD